MWAQLHLTCSQPHCFLMLHQHNKEVITSPPPKSFTPKVASKHLEISTKTKSVILSASTNDDSFFLPNQMPLAVKKPLTHQPVQTCEVSRSVTGPGSIITAHSKIRESMTVTKKCIDWPRILSSSTRTTISMQSTLMGASTSTSQLYQGMAVTRAKLKVAAPPSRVEQRSKTSMDEGVMKAKERVWLQKLAAVKKVKKAKEVEAAEVKKPESCSSTRGLVLSAQEGWKLAMECVRQHQEKENHVRLSNRMMVNGITTQPKQGASASTSHRVSTAVSQRRITIPKSPQLVTKAVLGRRPMGEMSEEVFWLWIRIRLHMHWVLQLMVIRKMLPPYGAPLDHASLCWRHRACQLQQNMVISLCLCC